MSRFLFFFFSLIFLYFILSSFFNISFFFFLTFLVFFIFFFCFFSFFFYSTFLRFFSLLLTGVDATVPFFRFSHLRLSPAFSPLPAPGILWSLAYLAGNFLLLPRAFFRTGRQVLFLRTAWPTRPC